MSGPYTAITWHRFSSVWFSGQPSIFEPGGGFSRGHGYLHLIAYLLERIAYRPLRNAPRLIP